MPGGPSAQQAMYENGSLSQVTGGPLRPGGLEITERTLALCQIRPGDRVLDIGCGSGSTLRYLMARYAAQPVGFDRSETLLQQARAQVADLNLTCASGLALPVASGQVDGVLSECSLSAMAGLDAFLAEAWRVLRPGGWLAINDVYARNPAGIPALRQLRMSCGLQEAFAQDVLIQALHQAGFWVQIWDDHSESLKDLSKKLVSAHGSPRAFWDQAEPEADPLDIIIAVNKAKVGYFVLVAKKNA